LFKVFFESAILKNVSRSVGVFYFTPKEISMKHHRVNSGLEEFASKRIRQRDFAPVPLQKPNIQKPSTLRFFTYFLIVIFVVTGVVLVVNFNRQSQQRIADNQTKIDEYTELLKPLPPLPTPTPTPERKPIVITSKPKGVYVVPDYSSKSYSPTPSRVPGYLSSGDSYSSGYSSGSSYSSSYGSKSVSVKGYYRKNGTYVSPYTRSRPRRR
jgi:hypothetical protein